MWKFLTIWMEHLGTIYGVMHEGFLLTSEPQSPDFIDDNNANSLPVEKDSGSVWTSLLSGDSLHICPEFSLQAMSPF